MATHDDHSQKYRSAIDRLGEVIGPKAEIAPENDENLRGIICPSEDIPSYIQIGETLAKEATQFVRQSVELSANFTQRICAIGIAALSNAQIDDSNKDTLR